MRLFEQFETEENILILICFLSFYTVSVSRYILKVSYKLNISNKLLFLNVILLLLYNGVDVGFRDHLNIHFSVPLDLQWFT